MESGKRRLEASERMSKNGYLPDLSRSKTTPPQTRGGQGGASEEPGWNASRSSTATVSRSTGGRRQRVAGRWPGLQAWTGGKILLDSFRGMWIIASGLVSSLAARGTHPKRSWRTVRAAGGCLRRAGVPGAWGCEILWIVAVSVLRGGAVRSSRDSTEETETNSFLPVKIREMRYGGELSETEFRTTKNVLGRMVSDRVKAKG